MSGAAAQIEAAHELVRQGKLAQAQQQLTRLLAKPPLNIDAAMLMSVACTSGGDPVKGAYWAQRVLAVLPDQPGAHANLVSALITQGKAEEALAAARRAAALLPDERTIAAALCLALGVAKRRVEGYRTLAAAIERFPDEERLYDTAVAGMLSVGRSDLALDFARGSTRRWPDNPKLASDLVRALAYAEDSTTNVPAALAAYQRAMSLGMGPPIGPGPVAPDPERRLRVGIVSGDVRDHAVMYFALPVIQRLDLARFELLVYSTTEKEDAVTRAVQARCVAFRRVRGLSPAALCQRMIDDRVDVLLELSGHTPGEMLGAVHLKPAPVIIHWIAFPGSIGLRAVDWRISDSLCDPPDQPQIGPDKPLRIDPCYVPYLPPASAPELAPGPSQRGEGIVFGSISSFMKVTDSGLRLWSDTVKAVPGSRMYFKSHWLDDADLRQDVLGRFERAGMPMDRLTLDGPSPGSAATMACYANFDITLDTYPYHGMTTTCESSYMGVPTVALAGRTVASRVNVSLLSALGLNDLVAGTPEGYVRTAAALAQDPARLAALRSAGPGGLRATMLASPLCDADGYTRKFEAALRSAWREWCASKRQA